MLAYYNIMIILVFQVLASSVKIQSQVYMPSLIMDYLYLTFKRLCGHHYRLTWLKFCINFINYLVAM